MTTVHTDYGPGQIVEERSERGHKSFRVAGHDWSLWVKESDLQVDTSRHSGAIYLEGEAPINRGNSVDLPYNPRPQYPTQVIDNESTIQPIHSIDIGDRTHPSDSLTFSDSENSEGGTYPGPNPDLFAEPHDSPRGSWEHPLGTDDSDNPDWGGFISDETNWRGGGSPWGDGETPKDFWYDHDNTDSITNFRESSHHFGEGYQDQGEAYPGQDTMNQTPDTGAPPAPGTSLPQAGEPGDDNSMNPVDKMTDAMGEMTDVANQWNDNPGMRRGGERLFGLDDRYAEVVIEGPWDKASSFQLDPIAYISRVGSIMEESGLDYETGEWMSLVEADKSIREAAWTDVRQKALRLRREGKVHVQDYNAESIMASVDGDHGTYDTLIVRGNVFDLGGQSVTSWHCGCEWGKWAFKRRYTYVGRFCSHAYATYLEMQARHNKGKPQWKRKSTRTPQGIDPKLHQEFDDAMRKPVQDPSQIDQRERQFQQKHEVDNPTMYGLDRIHPKHGQKTADALRTTPHRLTPDFVFDSTELPPQEDVDVQEDERHTVGPDEILHFAPISAGTGRERYQDKAYSQSRDRGREEHEQQDLLDEDYPDDSDYYGNPPGHDYSELHRQRKEKNPEIWGSQEDTRNRHAPGYDPDLNMDWQDGGDSGIREHDLSGRPIYEDEPERDALGNEEEFWKKHNDPFQTPKRRREGYLERLVREAETGPYVEDLGGYEGDYGDLGSADNEMSDRGTDELLDGLRDKARDEDIEDSFHNMDDRNDEIQDSVDELRERGWDADNLVANCHHSQGLNDQDTHILDSIEHLDPANSGLNQGAQDWINAGPKEAKKAYLKMCQTIGARPSREGWENFHRMAASGFPVTQEHQPFEGVGPAPVESYGSSSDYVDAFERPDYEDLTELDDAPEEMIKYTEGRGEKESARGEPKGDPKYQITKRHNNAPGITTQTMMRGGGSMTPGNAGINSPMGVEDDSTSMALDDINSFSGPGSDGITASRRDDHERFAPEVLPDPYARTSPGQFGGSSDGSDIVRQFQAGADWIFQESKTGPGGLYDIAGAAGEFLSKTAGRNYTPAQQAALMYESHPQGARNLDELDLEGTHYVGL